MLQVKSSAGEYEISERPIQDIVRSLPRHAYVITDENVWAAWGEHWQALPALVLPAGESSKSLQHAQKCWHWLVQSGATRSSTVIAFGGGVIGDLAGFVAATYMRGVGLVQVPTTLLAMVDSSVGGKVGIDLPQGKNLVGAFYPPKSVYIALETLNTLPERQFTNGMAEVCKYGAILDASLFETLANEQVKPTSELLPEIVDRCIRIKADVVESDEFEISGIRATLNFGHTIGHALEKVTEYKELLHGEAISIGMVAESRLGEAIGVTSQGTTERLQACLRNNDLPIEMPDVSEQEMLEAMRVDKKALPGQLAFSLLTEIGRCKLCTGVPEAQVVEVLKAR